MDIESRLENYTFTELKTIKDHRKVPTKGRLTKDILVSLLINVEGIEKECDKIDNIRHRNKLSNYILRGNFVKFRSFYRCDGSESEGLLFTACHLRKPEIFAYILENDKRYQEFTLENIECVVCELILQNDIELLEILLVKNPPKYIFYLLLVRYRSSFSINLHNDVSQRIRKYIE